MRSANVKDIWANFIKTRANNDSPLQNVTLSRNFPAIRLTLLPQSATIQQQGRTGVATRLLAHFLLCSKVGKVTKLFDEEGSESV